MSLLRSVLVEIKFKRDEVIVEPRKDDVTIGVRSHRIICEVGNTTHVDTLPQLDVSFHPPVTACIRETREKNNIYHSKIKGGGRGTSGLTSDAHRVAEI